MTTTAQALEALEKMANAAYEGMWPPDVDGLEATIRQHIESTAAELARLQAECEALRKDAERWRTLRDSLPPVCHSHTQMPCISVPLRQDMSYTCEGLVRAVDDVMADIAALSTSTAPSGAEE